MNQYLFFALFAITFTHHAYAVEYICPAQIQRSGSVVKSPPKWMVLGKSSATTTSTGDIVGFSSVSPRDGELDELGSLIPDNDETGFEDGFWLWRVRGLQSPSSKLFVVCEYKNSKIILVQQIFSRVNECRASVKHKVADNTLRCN